MCRRACDLMAKPVQMGQSEARKGACATPGSIWWLETEWSEVHVREAGRPVRRGEPGRSQSVHSSDEAFVMSVERRDAGRWIGDVQTDGRTTGDSAEG